MNKVLPAKSAPVEKARNAKVTAIQEASHTQFSFSFFSPRLSLKDQALFAKRLSLLVKAGVPLLKSITILETQAKGANRTMFHHIARDVANGQYLSKSMKKYRKAFGDYAINLIHVGETSGTLSENLKYLADELDKRRQLRGKIVGALVYPAVILVASLGVSGLMTAYLFPKLMPIFKSLNVDLPFTTRALIHISDFLIIYWWALLIAAFTMPIVFFFCLKTFPRFKYAFNFITLKIPVVGSLLTYYHLVNTARTLGTLFHSSIRVLEAISVTERTSTNLVYRRSLNKMHDFIARGGRLSKHMEKYPKLYPPMFAQMVEIGETTGSLSDTLIYLGEIYEQELDEQTKRLSSVIEPAMMIVMGILVGFIAVSIITPIYAVTQNIHP